MFGSPASAKGGRLPGQPNFKEGEDLALARAYLKETTCAAVGTDQSGETFWQKIRLSFDSETSPAAVDRTAISLSNRWNNVLSKEIGKWVGCLTASLREYHSGWQYADYEEDAQVQFALGSGSNKRFKHTTVYSIVRALPKFSVPADQINSRVKTAIGLDEVRDEGGEEPIVSMAERPQIGKKQPRRQSLTKSTAILTLIMKF